MGKRRIWQLPWGYKEGFVLALGLLFIGFLLQFSIGGKEVNLASFPNNLIMGLSYTAIISLLYIKFKNTDLFKFLTGVPASISLMTIVTLLVVVMGFFPQGIQQDHSLISKLGFYDLTKSYAFFFLFTYFTTVLWLITLKRLIPFRKKNIGFLLNHFGLWLVVFCAGLGTSDLQRLSVDLYENNKKLEWRGTDASRQVVPLPIAFKLIDFELEEYAPKIGLVNNETGKLEDDKGKNLFRVDQEGYLSFKDYRIYIDTYLPSAGRIGDRYEAVIDLGTPPAAKVKAENTENGDTKVGWVSCGSFTTQPEALRLNDQYSIIMLYPESKKYLSKLEVYTKSGTHDTLSLEVNKPLNLEGYEIYQLSYNSELGKWSNLSTLELVRDPWLPYVYTGLFLLIAGAIYMFWIGKNISKD